LAESAGGGLKCTQTSGKGHETGIFALKLPRHGSLAPAAKVDRKSTYNGEAVQTALQTGFSEIGTF
jgi:hypothetical protein